MSPDAARLGLLRQLLADLRAWLDNWPPQLKHHHQRKRRTRANAQRMEDILREVASNLIADGCGSLGQGDAGR